MNVKKNNIEFKFINWFVQFTYYYQKCEICNIYRRIKIFNRFKTVGLIFPLILTGGQFFWQWSGQEPARSWSSVGGLSSGWHGAIADGDDDPRWMDASAIFVADELGEALAVSRTTAKSISAIVRRRFGAIRNTVLGVHIPTVAHATDLYAMVVYRWTIAAHRGILLGLEKHSSVIG